ncbi:hypothetical protein SKAU_G00277960 [Synaphobranchus kaupii]|uniref:DUF6729 domain-containing protein n=1 Tax=Synaphobranchus kaupii TaxID=118154 RepID=A0A9Q1EWL2_SYNKA|nr:hypothetical protein SKAU_G00277960 [Synaphobranchus kaupii]
MPNKDALTHYTSAYPDIVELVKFHKAQEVARFLASQHGQKGAALVGFGQYKLDSLLGLRSLSPGELQAKLKKMLTTGPVVPGVSSSQPVLCPVQPEPSDAELMELALSRSLSLRSLSLPLHLLWKKRNGPSSHQGPPHKVLSCRLDWSGAVSQEQRGEYGTHHGPVSVVAPSPALCYLLPTSRLASCLLRMSAVPLDAPPHVGFEADMCPAWSLSCDLRVMKLLREQALGNSATQLYTKLCEGHSEAWMRRSIQYLDECEHFLAMGPEQRAFPPPPPMPPVPTPVWLLNVYCYDVLSRLDEVRARVTSTFGSILKMDSTKKVTKKLAGFAADTAAWATNVGNEFGQVLISVLTSAKGKGLLPMAAGLMQRYRVAGVAPPSSCVTTESHQLYGTFMRQLSSSIFEWDEEDVRLLREAKRSELEGKRGMVGLTDAEVSMSLTKRELALHCSRCTRGAAVTERLVRELIDSFDGEKGHDTLGIPLLDHDCIQAI